MTINCDYLCEYAEIIQEKTFSEKIDLIHSAYERIVDVHAAIDFTLGRNPGGLPKIDQLTNLQMFPTS